MRLVFHMTLIGICSLSTLVFADESPLTFKPRVVAGVVCYRYAPAEFRQWLNDIQQKYKRPLSNFGAELDRTIERRFGDRLQIPYPKGLMFVDTPAGIENWFCEQSFTREGAREVIDDFAAQWQTEEKKDRPNYEVEVKDLSPDAWSLTFNNLTWTPKLVEMTDAEKKETGLRSKTEWSVSKRPGRAVWFRFDGDWLWSSYSEHLLNAETLDVIPDSEDLNDAIDSGLFARGWFNPNQLSQQLRNSFLTVIEALLAVQSQQRDGELVEDSHRRKVWNTCRAALPRAALNDVEFAEFRILTSTEKISVHVEIVAKSGSEFSQFLNETVPEEIVSAPALDQTSGIAVRIIGRVPKVALSTFQRENNGAFAGSTDFVAEGKINCNTFEEFYGWLTVRCSDAQRTLIALSDVVPEILNYEVNHSIFHDTPIHVSTEVNPDESLLQSVFSGPLASRDFEFDKLPAANVRSNGIRFQRAVAELQADAKTIESIAGDWLPVNAGNPDEATIDEPNIVLNARLRTGADRINLEFHSTSPFAHRAFAALVLRK